MDILASIKAGELKASPFLRRDGDVVRELVSGATFTMSPPEAALLARADPALSIASLATDERAIASSLLTRRLLLDEEALAEIGRRTLGMIDLEIAGACNAECTFCPRDELKAGRGVGIMKDETFRAVLAKLAPYVKFVGFAGIGEPTLNKHLPQYVTELTRQRIQTMLVTNGSMLTEELTQQLLDAGLASIQVSLNGLDRDSYAEHMVGLDLADTLPHVERMIEQVRGRIPVGISAVETTRNHDQLAGFVEYWRAKGVQATVVPTHSRGGTIVPLRPRRGPDPMPRCGLFASRVFISWDGRMLACCHDIDGQTELGNIKTDTAEMIIAKKLEVMKNSEWFPVCHTCDEPARLDRVAFRARTLS